MSQHNEGSNETSAAIGPLSQIGSIAFIFFCGPYFYRASIGTVQEFTLANYGLDGWVVNYFWIGMIGVGGYGVGNFVIYLLLSLGIFGLVQGRRR